MAVKINVVLQEGEIGEVGFDTEKEADAFVLGAQFGVAAHPVAFVGFSNGDHNRYERNPDLPRMQDFLDEVREDLNANKAQRQQSHADAQLAAVQPADDEPEAGVIEIDTDDPFWAAIQRLNDSMGGGS